MKHLTFLKLGGGGFNPLLDNLLCDDWWANLINLGTQDRHDFSPTRIERYDPSDQWFGHYVEPHPYHVIQLTKYLRERYDPDKYKIYQCCVGGYSSLQLFSPETLESIGEGSGLSEVQKKESNFYVPVFTLQDLLNEISCKPDYIHMNIEGAEETVLENYNFEHKPETIAIETHKGLSISPHKIGSILEENGYYGFFEPYDANGDHTMVIGYKESQ